MNGKVAIRRFLLLFLLGTGSISLLLGFGRVMFTSADTTFAVNSNADAVDANPGDGVCASSNGDCTLRAAIQEANALAGTDTIDLPGDTYRISIAGAEENKAATGDLDILDDLILNGAGASVTVLDGNGLDRLFEINGVDAVVQITGVTIRNGNASFGGGGIYNGGILALSDSAVISSTSSFTGGGIFNAGSLTVRNSLIQGNSAQDGGGILNTAALTITHSTIRRNDAYLGGGIQNFDTATIYNSTISDNIVKFHGGGIRSVAATPAGQASITLINSTISGNWATQNGGGIFNQQSTLDLSNVTVTRNTADELDEGAGDGGGIFAAVGSDIRLRNSILAENDDRSGEAPDCSGSLTSDGYNLLGDETGCAFAFTTGDRLNDAPQLYPLRDNGGPTETHALRPDSALLDGGEPAGCTDNNGNLLITDQRGLARPAEGNGDSTTSCDVGAFEAAPVTFTVNSEADIVDANPGDGDCDTGNRVGDEPECTLRAAVQEANAKAAPDTIQLPAGTYRLALVGAGEDAAATGDLDVNDPLTLNGAGADRTFIDGNGLDRIFHVHLFHAAATASNYLSGVTIRNGDDGNAGGGGIYNNNLLTVAHSTIISNTGGVGGGILNSRTMTVTYSTIVGNTARLGGGLQNQNLLTMLNSTVDRNVSNGLAGGIGNSDVLILRNTTVSRNTAEFAGGGIHSFASPGSTAATMLSNSTISGNRAKSHGGGLLSTSGFQGISSLILNNVTITANTADSDGNGDGDGGGLFTNPGEDVIIRNSLIAGNSDGGGESPDCGGSWPADASAGYNLLGSAEGCDFVPAAGDQTGTNADPLNPLLGLLEDNGGSTTTHALLPDSPAIDAGNNDTCEAADQRNAPRPADGNEDGAAVCDIGVYEYGSLPIVPTATPTATVSSTPPSTPSPTVSPTATVTTTPTPGPSPTPSLPTPITVLYMPATFR